MMRGVLTALILLLAVPAYAVVTFDNQADGAVDGFDELSFDLGVGALCTNPIVVTSVTWGSTGIALMTGQTIGGTNATQVAGVTNTDAGRRIELWRRVGVSTGTNTIVTSFDNANQATISARSYCGVHQTVPLGTAATAFDVTATPTVNVTATTNDIVIDTMTSGAVATVVGAGLGQTNVFIMDDFTVPGFELYRHRESEEVGAATVTMSYELSEADYWAIIGVALKPAAGGVAAPVVRRIINIQ
jgi:hypothetical protein